MEEMFGQMFDRMHVGETDALVRQYTRPRTIPVPMPEGLAAALGGSSAR